MRSSTCAIMDRRKFFSFIHEIVALLGVYRELVYLIVRLVLRFDIFKQTAVRQYHH